MPEDLTGKRLTLTAELSQYDITLMDPQDAIVTLQCALDTAAICAVPYRTVRVGKPKHSRVRWTPELKEAVAWSKIKMFEWKVAGEPKDDHHTRIAKRRATKMVRSVSRQQEAQDRRQKLQQISEASVADQALFHRLVHKQRETDSSATAIVVNGTLTTEDETIREGWADYYDTLSTPDHDETALKEILKHLRGLALATNDQIQTSHTEMEEIILKLKPKKAADRDGYRAEHLKLLLQSEIALHYLTSVFNSILHNRNMPKAMKSAYKIPIPKKGKDCHIMDNHRGITVSSIFGKLLEHLCLKHSKDDIEKKQDSLQFGFTEGCSPSMASLIISEAVAESVDIGKNAYICSLDARKAFDVVSHQKLKLKLYQSDMKRSLWLLVDSMYQDSPESVRWAGTLSRDYEVQQGVKQGAVMSPMLYKYYVNELHQSLRSQLMGLTIGTVYVGAPACADDFALLSHTPAELQGMVDVCVNYSKDHHYTLHPTKSLVTHLRKLKVDKHKEYTWHMGEESMTVTDSFQHLGLEWQSDMPTPNIQSKVSQARRTAYSLFGSGFHGHNGLDAHACLKLCSTYVVSVLVYGLEATSLSQKQYTQIDTFHKDLMRQIQSLPQNTATPAVLLLGGSLPARAILHMRLFSFYGNITRLDRQSSLRRLAERQLAVKEEGSKSWFLALARLGESYRINIHQALANPWPKEIWKRHVNRLIKASWLDTLSLEASKMKTLYWLIVHPHWTGSPHPMWQACRGKPYQMEASEVRAKLLVSRYPLQYNRVNFTKQESDPSCPLCHDGIEDVVHFLTSCPALGTMSEGKIYDLQQMYASEGLPPPGTPEEVTSAILNGWGYVRGSQQSSLVDFHVSSPPVGSGSEHGLFPVDPVSTGVVYVNSHHGEGGPRSGPVPQLSDDHLVPTLGCRPVKQYSPSILLTKVTVLKITKLCTDNVYRTLNVVPLKQNCIPANQLCNTICHQRHLKRDSVYNLLLLQQQGGGSPDKAEGSN